MEDEGRLYFDRDVGLDDIQMQMPQRIS
jgi:hypothetical protein